MPWKELTVAAGLTGAALVGAAMPALADAVPSAADRDALRRQWHRCVRQEFSGQPLSVRKAAAERAALARCKADEDALVAAELAASEAADATRRREHASLTTRARAWVASVAASVVDPVASWFSGLAR